MTPERKPDHPIRPHASESEEPTLPPKGVTEEGDAPAEAEVRPLPPTEVHADNATLPPQHPRSPSGSEESGFPSIPGYEIESELGRGGMGVVYKARHLHLNRVVALKMVLSGAAAGPNDLARFRSEAEAVAGLNHPNVVQIHEVGTHQGLPFFTLEFCPGGSLDDLLREGPMPARKAAEAVEAVAHGVAAAHAAGIIHRDLKPANVLLGEDGTPKVTDFGLAKKVNAGDGPTASGAVLGTPSYMAPEQAGQGKRVGPAADVYGLGAVLYRLLTGRPPFQADTALDTILKVVSEEPSTPRSVNAGVPRDLEVITLKCLSKEPQKRYASAEALADDLRRWLDGKPITARPVGAAERATKWVKRNTAVAASILAVSLALIAASIVSTRYALAEAEQRTRAEQERDAKELARQAEEEQRKLAQRAEAAARESQADTEAFSRFLVEDVLAVARPEGVRGGLGVDVTVATALAHAEKTIEERFRGRPLAEATARDALGKTWNNLGNYPAAERHFRRAIRLRGEHLGEDAPETLDSRNSLGVTLSQAGQHDASIRLHQQMLRHREAVQGSDHPDTLTTRNNLASAYVEAGRLAEAIPLFELTLRQREAGLGDDHLDTLQTRYDLALAYRDVGRPAESLHLLELTHRHREAQLGGDHPDTLQTRNSLAGAYEDAGRLGEAIPLLERTLEQQVVKLGDDHPQTLSTRNNLANAYRSAGRLGEAIPLYERSFEQFEATLGEDHPNTLASRNNLASAYQAAGRLAEAMPLYERMLEQSVAKLGEDHPFIPTCRNNLAGAYRDAGRLGDAISLYERAYAGIVKRRFQHPDAFTIQANLIDAYQQAERFDKLEPVLQERLQLLRANAPSGHPVIQSTLAQLGECRLSLKKYAEAESACRECLQIRESAMPNSWLTANARSMLGEALLGQGKHAEAEPMLLAGRSDMASAFNTGQPEELPPSAPRTQRLLEATARLVRLYDAADRLDQAAKWKAEWAALLLSHWPVRTR